MKSQILFSVFLIAMTLFLAVSTDGQQVSAQDKTASTLSSEEALVAMAHGRLFSGDVQTKQATVAPDSLLQVPVPSNDLASADGSIAFSSNRQATYDIFSVDPGGGNTRKLVSGGGEDATPVWSPDGRRLLFSSDRDGDFEIFILESDGNVYQLTRNNVADIHPSWSPDGRSILFSSDRDGEYFQIFRMDVDGSNVRSVGTVAGNNALHARYSPDGNKIAFMRASTLIPTCVWNWDIWTMKADGSDQRRVTDHLAGDLFPEWTQDGRIIYGGCRSFLDADLFIVDPESGNESRLTEWFLSNEWNAVFSSDKSHLAFNSDVTGDVEIFTANLADGQAVNLSQHTADDLAPSWGSPIQTGSGVSGKVVDSRYAPIPDVTIAISPGGTTQTNTAGNFSFANLAAGTYTITPSKDGYSFEPASHSVNVPPDSNNLSFVGEPPFDLSIDSIEISQVFLADKDPVTKQEIPLIAEKDTFIRVFVQVDGKETVENVGVHLFLRNQHGKVHRLDQAVNGEAFIARGSPDRNSLEHSVNFWPDDELVAGKVTVWAEVDPENKIAESDEMNNVGGNATKSFQEGKKLRVAWTIIGYGTAENPVYPDIQTAAMGSRFLESIFPLGEGDFEYVYQPGFGKVIKDKFTCPIGLISCPAMNDYLASLNRFWNRTSRTDGWRGGEPPDRLYGWYPNEARIPEGICGIADATWGSLFGKGRVATGGDYCDKPGGILIPPERVMAHEIGHILNDDGLRHTPNSSNDQDKNCFKKSPGANSNHPSYPGFPKGSIGVPGFDITGFRVLDPGSVYDFMSYCQESWVSPYNYNLLNSGFPDQSSMQLTSPRALQRQLLVSGKVNSPTLEVAFDPFYSLMSDISPDPSFAGDYCLELWNSENVVMESNCFGLDFLNPVEGYPIAEDSFALVVPYPADTSRIVLTYQGVKLESRDVSDNVPTVEITDPTGGEMWSADGIYTVTWAASDQDNDDLYFSLEYSIDSGASWVPIAEDITEQSYELDVGLLPGGDAILIRVGVSDGVNTSYDSLTTSISVGRKPPIVAILSPTSQANTPPDTPVLLRAEAFDLEDGTLEEDSLKWFSNRQGLLGNGKQLLVMLQPDFHEISVVAMDSDGDKSSESVTVYVGYRIHLPYVGRN